MIDKNAAAVLFTINLRSIAEFYEQVVAMRVHRTERTRIDLEKNGFLLTVHQIPAEYAANVYISVPPQVREISAIKLSLPVASLIKARQAAAQLGGCVYAPDREWEYEHTTVCDGWDPDGNVFQLFQPLTR
jgi:predicted enzyme related to lactoylglutathione lyase